VKSGVECQLIIDWVWLTIISVVLGALGFSKRTLQQRMNAFAAQAVALAKKEFNTNLDFKIESVPQLDSILDQFHQRHRQTPIPERELSQIVLIWGAYLGETLQRQLGGEWATDSPVAGKNTYPLQWPSKEAVPIMWCLRRIRKGQEAKLIENVQQIVNAA
jgi:hypothetical protein